MPLEELLDWFDRQEREPIGQRHFHDIVAVLFSFMDMILQANCNNKEIKSSYEKNNYSKTGSIMKTLTYILVDRRKLTDEEKAIAVKKLHDDYKNIM